MDSKQPAVPIWPPAYTLKKHPRAKRIRLRASPRRGLEVIVPLSFDAKQLPALLEKHRTWIEKQFSQFFLTLMPQPDFLPTDLNLQAAHAHWQILYQATAAHLRLRAYPRQKKLVLTGMLDDREACKKKLLLWVKTFAKKQLPVFLARTSLEVGLPYSKSSVRDQKTRWGSCSRAKGISLNYKLIFLPPPLVRHILLHELCHTIHLNHAPQFWDLLASHDPHWQEHRQAMKKANQHLPPWLF